MKEDILLQIAADVLEVDPKQWNMELWWKPNCVTVGCAIGHSVAKGHIPGLRIESLPEIFQDGDELAPHFAIGSDGDLTGMDAVAAALDLNYADADYLFYPASYETDIPVTQDQVADRIRTFVAQGKARTERNKWMAARAMWRPGNYNTLSAQDQWEIDKQLGILDWDGRSGM